MAIRNEIEFVSKGFDQVEGNYKGLQSLSKDTFTGLRTDFDGANKGIDTHGKAMGGLRDIYMAHRGELRLQNGLYREFSHAAGGAALIVTALGLANDNANTSTGKFVKGAKEGLVTFQGLSFALAAVPYGQVIAGALGVFAAIAEMNKGAEKSNEIWQSQKEFVEALDKAYTEWVNKLHGTRDANQQASKEEANGIRQRLSSYNNFYRDLTEGTIKTYSYMGKVYTERVKGDSEADKRMAESRKKNADAAKVYDDAFRKAREDGKSESDAEKAAMDALKASILGYRDQLAAVNGVVVQSTTTGRQYTNSLDDMRKKLNEINLSEAHSSLERIQMERKRALEQLAIEEEREKRKQPDDTAEVEKEYRQKREDTNHDYDEREIEDKKEMDRQLRQMESETSLNYLKIQKEDSLMYARGAQDRIAIERDFTLAVLAEKERVELANEKDDRKRQAIIDRYKSERQAAEANSKRESKQTEKDDAATVAPNLARWMATIRQDQYLTATYGDRWVAELRNAETAINIVSAGFDAVFNALDTGFINEWNKTLGEAHSLFEIFLQGMLAEVLKTLEQIAAKKAMMGLLDLFSGGIFGGAAGVATGGAEDLPFLAHSGGEIQKAHTGGMYVTPSGRLASDEVPAILQVGEMVLSRSQTKALKGGAGVSHHKVEVELKLTGNPQGWKGFVNQTDIRRELVKSITDAVMKEKAN